MKNWRFRTTLTGKLILQRYIGYDGPVEFWIDARTEDLLDFYKETQN